MPNNKLKRAISVVLSLSIMISSPQVGNAADLMPNNSRNSSDSSYGPFPANSDEFSGTCGNDIEWDLDPDVGLLNISGVSKDILSHHNMDNYNYYNETPWALYKDSIRSVEIGGLINNIGNHAFDNCTNLTSVTLGHLDYPNFIGSHAFYNCKKLEQFKYEGSAQPDCGNDVFNGSKKLNEVIVPADYSDNECCGLPVKRHWSGSDYGFVVLMSVVSSFFGMLCGFFCRLCGSSGSYVIIVD